VSTGGAENFGRCREKSEAGEARCGAVVEAVAVLGCAVAVPLVGALRRVAVLSRMQVTAASSMRSPVLSRIRFTDW
jgi:hypothetical protein